MSRSSRRKTLSHSEIENFLSELSLPKQIDESLPETSPVSVDEPFISFTELVSTQDAVRGEPDEVVWIRELCKLKFSSPAVQSMSHMKRLEIGRCILQSSNYRILPTRMLRPDLYDHPSSSLEGKKKLLLSLSPMLTDNEAQRKSDITACEEFTRCRSGKGKGRLANYEYTDMDTNALVEHDDYERRYLNFIQVNKPKSYDLSGSSRSSPPMDPNVMLTNKIPELLEVYNLETPSVYVKEVSIKKKSELIQFDSMGKENMINSSSFGGSSSSTSINHVNILPTETEAFAKPYVASVPLNSLVPKKSKENDRKRKNNTFGSERRVTLSPATARAMMLKAFEEDEPTVFPACPVFDYDLGSNSMVSPSRLLIKEFKSPDVFSNPNFIDCEESDEVAPAAPSHLAVKLFIDELPVETPVFAAQTATESSSSEDPSVEVLMDVEKTDSDIIEIVVVPSSASKSKRSSPAKEVVVIDLTEEPSGPSVSPLKEQAVSEVPVKPVAVSASVHLEQDLDNFSRELDGILANDDDIFSVSPRASEAVFKFPSCEVVEVLPQVPVLDSSTPATPAAVSSLESALDSLDALLSTDDVISLDEEEDAMVGSNAPSLEFLASVAMQRTVETTVMPVLERVEEEEKVVVDVVVNEAVVETDRPSSTVQMVEEQEEEEADDCELVQVMSSASDATTEASESSSSSSSAVSATIELTRSTSSSSGMLLDRENAKSVLQEAYSLLNEGATDLETFKMIETLIVKAEEVGGGGAISPTTAGVVIDSALYAFCNDAPLTAVPSSSSSYSNDAMQSASTDYDDDEEYPYFKPLDRKTTVTNSTVDAATSNEEIVICSSEDVVASSEVEMTDLVGTDQAVSESVSESVSSIQFDDIYGEPLDYGLAQEKAYKQRLIRFEIARWKYQWELVSVKAANEAIARAKSRYNV